MKCPFCVKVCTKCNRILVAYTGNFGKQKGGKYELDSICKECRKAYAKQHYRDNIDKYKAYRKQHYQDNIDKEKAYYQDNIDKIKAYYKEYAKQYYDNYLADNGLERGCGSYGEQLVRKALQDKGIEFVEQHTFPDCRYKYVLKFDFYIPALNTCIEFDGEQHYRPVDTFGGEERFKEDKIRDSIKETYCKEHNITLIRIPYYDIDNVETIIAMLI